MSVDYTSTMPFGITLKFTPASGPGAGTAVDIDAILKLTTPNLDADIIKWTPLDGAQAGREQGVAGKIKMTECSMSVVYTKARYAALAALHRIPGLYVLTKEDGGAISIGDSTNGWTTMTKISETELNAENVHTIDLTFNVPGGWTVPA